VHADGSELRPGGLPDEKVDIWVAAADVVVMLYDRGSPPGVLHRAISVTTPVLASPSLAEEAESTGARRLVSPAIGAWSDAIFGALGPDRMPPPPAPTGGHTTVRATIHVYAEVLDWCEGRPTGGGQ
jgi:hypothetical protein